MRLHFASNVGNRALRRGALAVSVVAVGVLAGGPAQAAATTPVITSITPNWGSVVGGEQVTINGSNFVGQNGACNTGYDIWFGTDLAHGYAITPTSYQVLSDSQIKVTVPANFGTMSDVRVVNACGASPVSPADQFTWTYPSSQCLSGTCSVAISSSQVGKLNYSALGFLNGFNTDAGVPLTVSDGNLVKALHPRWWRFGQSGLNEPWGGEFGLARQWGAKISLDLTTDWTNWANVNDPANARTPYNDLSTYSSFISNDVRNRIAANQVPDYFDVWNEGVNTGTVNQWLSVFGAAYQAIKAADPSAQVVGPSIGWFLIQSGGHPDTPGYDLSLTDFLNWEMSTGDRFAAISYHEDGQPVDAAPNSSPGPWLPAEPVPGGYRDYWSPAAIGTHVTLAKQLIASYPALAGTQVFVNEYGPTYGVDIPGWMVGDFSALEGAGADEAMMTCATQSACDSLWDGLIGVDGTPQMPYWLMMDYSQMSGSRLQTSGSGSNWYTLATRVSGANEIEALVGRADDCWGTVQCPQFHSVSTPAAALSLSLSIPWSASAVDLSVQRLANTTANPIGYNDLASAPTTTTISNVAVKNGQATVSIPSVADGDALYITASSTTSSSTTGKVTRVSLARVTAPGSARPRCRKAAPRGSRHPRRRCRARTRARHAHRRDAHRL